MHRAMQMYYAVATRPHVPMISTKTAINVHLIGYYAQIRLIATPNGLSQLRNLQMVTLKQVLLLWECSTVK